MQIEEVTEHPDFLRVMDYILKRELGVITDGKVHRYTMREYADEQGVSRQTVYAWLEKWKQAGLLAKVREKMMIPVGEEVIIAKRKVLSAYPELIDEMVRIALKGQKDQDRREAIMWLHEQIVEPQMAATPEVGADEARYIIQKRGNPNAFSPLAILAEPAENSATRPE